MKSSVMSTYNRLGATFKSGKGAWLYDVDGNSYLDALAGISVCSLGHANSEVSAAISEQAHELIHTSNLYQIPHQQALADKLCHYSGLDQVFFANSGAEANEAAIKIARKYAHSINLEDPVIIVMEGSFHGRTIATLTATGNEKIKEGFGPLVQGFHHIPYADIAALNELKKTDMNIVAVMLEPIQGEGGIVIPPAGYLKAVSDCCRENGWLLILDEIQTGMCRTGRWFACQHESVTPDIMTLAKALGNGLPIGACLAKEHVAKIMQPGSHGSTFGGNPLSSRAGLAVVDYMESHHIPERVEKLGALMLEQFEHNLKNIDGVKSIRAKGLMIGIELDQDCGQLVKDALQERILINVTAGNVVRLLPPLIISDDEAKQIVTQVTGLITKFLSST